MSPPAPPRDPFRSARLIYRAVIPADDSVFAAIDADRIGYINSNASNIKLPGPADAERFRKSVSEELLGAIICLPSTFPPPSTTGSNSSRTSTPGPAPPPIPIGQIHLKGSSQNHRHHRNTELGVDILPLYQGKGYGGEAIRWALDYAFRRAGLHKVRIRAFEWNEGAVRLYERIGFKHEGRERESLWHEGRFWDGIEMGMVEREWWELQREEREKEGAPI
ncbi:acyl-CoA N-acyltransferase [Massarina eburnea CBS 473.64]|uniref:Acyl-CoA N-acyltransferase n=1 Tax=Massarina eburnea CBS 473.64 TaxID=1395130 RepID=A0A6A6S721_9PLEO|nr:acyl-CoA N-acyltransferase [Massarina eburnea CBS 473.64]